MSPGDTVCRGARGRGCLPRRAVTCRECSSPEREREGGKMRGRGRVEEMGGDEERRRGEGSEPTKPFDIVHRAAGFGIRSAGS